MRTAFQKSTFYILFSTLLIAVVFSLDRYTKNFMMQPAHGELHLFSGIFDLTTHRNFGIIANIPIPLFIIVAVTLLVLFLIIMTLIRALHREQPQESFALSLIVAGALGNLWDRIAWGFVFDWILLFNRSVINFADIAIAVGVVWYAWIKWRKQA